MLGILDWGIGGLSVLSRLQHVQPELEFVYVSDSGSVPYGKMSALELRARVVGVFARLPDVDSWIIACNAASTVFLGETSWQHLPLANVIDPALAHLKASSLRDLGVIGGVRTVESQAYSRGLGENFRVAERSAQPLSAMIERGQVDGPELREFLNQLFHGWNAQTIQGLVLACTHYPAVRPEIAELLPGVELIDPAEWLPHSLPEQLARPRGASSRFYTTGDVRAAQQGARLAFGCHQVFHPLPRDRCIKTADGG